MNHIYLYYYAQSYIKEMHRQAENQRLVNLANACREHGVRWLASLAQWTGGRYTRIGAALQARAEPQKTRGECATSEG